MSSTRDFVVSALSDAALPTLKQVLEDVVMETLNAQQVPTRTDFKHIFDTPSDAAGHIKASLVGNQHTLIIHEGKAVLGHSQGIFFWEYDGPRKRQLHLKIVEC